MKYFLAVLALAAFFFIVGDGCDGDHDAAEATTEEAHKHEHEHEHEHEHQPAQSGEDAQSFTDEDQKTASGKWKANPETTQGIESMMEMVGSFSTDGGAAHCEKLQRVLDATFTRILQQCTMQGKAHDALHEYLIPLKKKIGEISSDDVAQCEGKVREISEYLATYHEQFE